MVIHYLLLRHTKSDSFVRVLFSDVPTKRLVTVETFKTVKILSLNRPDKQNALNEALLRELASHLSEFEEDTSASVVVINGNGGNFSIGYDIDELEQKCEQDADAVRSSIFVC